MTALLPNNEIKNGGSFKVKSDSSDSVYELKNRGGVYSCDCTAWRQQSKPTNKRSCKHLQQYLGEEFETKRCGGNLIITKKQGQKRKEKIKAKKSIKKKKNDSEKENEQEEEAGEDDEKDEEKKEVVQLLLAQKYEEKKHDVVGWWMSEKLDGVRCYWNGSKLLSRNGNMFHAPEWFLRGFPKDQTFDGELFLKRSSFSDTVSIVRSHGLDEEWKTIKYLIFDMPSCKKPFEERVQEIEKWVAIINSPHFLAVAQTKCKSALDLQANMKSILALGGEGVMCREPKSMYVNKRSSTLLKVKVMSDAEALIIGHTKGQGKHKGLVGALECKLPNGNKFKVGTGLSDELRKNPPKIGETITFTFQELSKSGTPRFPVYKGISIDKTIN